VLDGVARRAGDHRRAAQAVGVLDAVVAVAVAGDDRGAGEDLAQVGGAGGLAGLRAQRDEVLGEDAVGAQQALDGHRGGDVGGREQVVQVGQGEDQHPQHAVGAVDERQALLGLEGQRRDAGLAEGLGGRAGDAVGVDDLALADQRERAVGQRREVARGAERAVLAHHRGDAGVEQREDRLGDDRPRARVAHRQGACAQQHHRAHDLALDRRAHPGRVRAHERALQLLAPAGGDDDVGQRAEPGRDAVRRLGRVEQPVDDPGAGRHDLPRGIRQRHPRARASDRDDILGLDRGPRQLHGVAHRGAAYGLGRVVARPFRLGSETRVGRYGVEAWWTGVVLRGWRGRSRWGVGVVAGAVGACAWPVRGGAGVAPHRQERAVGWRRGASGVVRRRLGAGGSGPKRGSVSFRGDLFATRRHGSPMRRRPSDPCRLVVTYSPPGDTDHPAPSLRDRTARPPGAGGRQDDAQRRRKRLAPLGEEQRWRCLRPRSAPDARATTSAPPTRARPGTRAARRQSTTPPRGTPLVRAI
jgi:hypothetical protein